MLNSVSLTFNNPQINVISNPNARLRPLARFGSSVVRCSAMCVERKRWLGTGLRRSGSGRSQFLESVRPGRLPKLRVTVKSSFSAIPEKPMGLYDPAFDKDACGVGFVAELSGQSSRKTVRIIFFVFLFLVWDWVICDWDWNWDCVFVCIGDWCVGDVDTDDAQRRLRLRS